MGKDHCPHCGEILDAATAAEGKHEIPNPGDVSVCIYCAGLLVYADDMALTKLSDELFNSIPLEVRLELSKARYNIRKFNEQQQYLKNNRN